MISDVTEDSIQQNPVFSNINLSDIQTKIRNNKTSYCFLIICLYSQRKVRVMPLHDKSLRAPQSSVSYTFLWISRTLYFMIPAGISTSTTSPVCAPISAFPTGDSLEILPSRLLASVEPTIFSSMSSSNSKSCTLTLHPTLILSRSTSSSTTTSAFFKIFSISSIRASMSLCSSFAASYSAFSDKSPCSLASLIFSATSFLFTTFKSCSSSSNFLSPA